MINSYLTISHNSYKWIIKYTSYLISLIKKITIIFFSFIYHLPKNILMIMIQCCKILKSHILLFCYKFKYLQTISTFLSQKNILIFWQIIMILFVILLQM